ncbi:unnamed protein product, partial [Rotaria socialis]
VTQSAYPNGLFVDALGTLYVAESKNDRVMRWVQGAKQGTLIVGGTGRGAGANQLNSPLDYDSESQGFKMAYVIGALFSSDQFCELMKSNSVVGAQVAHEMVKNLADSDRQSQQLHELLSKYKELISDNKSDI